ncbi:hypothetical protein [Arthrobacter psychrochitiniphilus]|uniref:hypothetical protein n=1 Tax=Arthrobacter psychrochitiniphilus TaxID=291045 RepID=UPI003F7C2E4F
MSTPFRPQKAGKSARDAPPPLKPERDLETALTALLTGAYVACPTGETAESQKSAA